MTLGDLRDRLMQMPPETEVQIDGLDSYRGYYDQLAATTGTSTAEDLLLEIGGLLSGDTREGYKGGTYTYREGTPVWSAQDRGHCSSRALLGLTADGEQITQNIGEYA